MAGLVSWGRGARWHAVRIVVTALVVVGVCVAGAHAAFADHPEAWPEELTVDMLSEAQKAQIAAAYKDNPEQGTPEAFVKMWSAWWPVCLQSFRASGVESGEYLSVDKGWECGYAPQNARVRGILKFDDFYDWQGGEGLLQHLVDNYSLGTGYISHRNHDSTITAAIASMNARIGGADDFGQMGAWLVGGAAGAAGVDKNVISAVSNPSGQVAKFVNRLKKDGVGAIGESFSLMNTAFSFRADAVWFRSTYAAAAGAGVVLLAGNLVVSFARAARGQRPASEEFGRVGLSLVWGLFGLFMTPAVVHAVVGVVDAVSEGVAKAVGSSQGELTGSLLNPTTAMTTESTPLGWLGAIVVFVLCFVAGLMLMLSLAAQLATAYFSAVALGVMWGFVTSEKGRERLKRVGAFFVSALIAKPVILFFLWVAMRMSAAYSATVDGWSSDPMGTLLRVTFSLVAVMMVAVSPAWVAKFVPVAGGSSAGFSRGSLASGAAGGAVSGAAVAFGSRMERFSSASKYGRRSGSRQGEPGTPGTPGGSGGNGGHGRQGGGTLRLVASKIRRGGGKVVRGGGVALGVAGDAGRVAGQGARSAAAPLLDAAEGSAQSAERSLS